MRENLLKKQPTWGFRRAQGTGQKSATPATLTKVILVLLTMLLLPSAAWGEETTYTFTGTSLSGTTGTATSKITDETTYNWDIKNFYRTYYGQNTSYTGGSVTPTTTTLGFTVSSSEEITTSFHLVSSVGMTGTFVSATINYTLSNVTAAQVQVLKEDNNSYVPLSYGTETNGYTALNVAGSSATLEMSNMQAYVGNEILNDNKICFSFSFDSNDNNASITINSITITTTETSSNLTVAGVSPDSEGKFSGIGGVIFTPAEGANPATLTLNNANITVNGNNAIESGLENLTVNLVGDKNVITCQGSTDRVFKGTVSGAKVTFTTDATTPGVLNGSVLEDSYMFDGITPEYQNGLNYSRDGDSFSIKFGYGLKIGDTDITPYIGSDGTITGISAISSGTVKFTPADNTTTPATPAILTLDKATLGTNIKSTIKDLKVHLSGNNTITSSDGAFIYNGTESNPILIFSTVDPSDYENLGMLTINGISSKNDIASGYAIKGLVGETPKDINVSTLDTSVSGWKYEENSSPGQAYVKLLYREVYDLWISSHRYISDGLSYSSEIFNPATSTLTFNDIHGDSYQIYSGLPALTIEIGGDNKLKAISFGAPNGETISATSGTLTIKKNEESSSTVHELTLANADTDGGVISRFSSVTIEEPMGVKSPSPFTTWEGTHNAVISDAQFYDLWVGGVQVTSGNASDILGAAQSSQSSQPSQPTAVFNAENSILTLNGADISVSEEGGSAVVSGLENLTVKFEGSSSIEGQDLTTFYGFKALDGKTHNITFTASEGGYFVTQAGKDNAVFEFNKVTYNDGLVAYMDDGFFNIGKLEPELFFDIENDNNLKPVAISIKTEPEVTLVSHKIAYAIDYADENIADVPETEYTDVIPLATITAGPCTVSAYTLTLDGENTKSNNTDGYYFAYKESELTIGIGATVDLKDYLLPALPEGGVLINSTAESQEYISIKEGDYTITGNTNGTIVVNSFAEGEDIFTVFNQRLESEDFELKMNVTVKDVISNNTFSSGQSYGTFFNTTEAYNVPEGLKAYIITDVNEAKGTIEMTETSVLPPNTPVLMYRTSTTVSPNYVFTKASNVESVTTKLKYTTTDKPAEESSKLYVLYNGQFVKVTSGTKILANHCYLDLANTSSGTRSYYDIDGSDGTTSIREVKSEGVKGEKLADSAWHDLQGRKFTTKPTKPGLYILNGKKIVVK